jgi:hypothetical protein
MGYFYSLVLKSLEFPLTLACTQSSMELALIAGEIEGFEEGGAACGATV